MNSICPLCEHQKFDTIGIPKTNKISKEFIDKDYRIVQCKNCSLYFVSPQISFTDEQWNKLYSAEYFSAQSNWLIRKRAEELLQRFDKAVSFLGHSLKINFLDIGTGEGSTLIEALNRGWDVTGIDIVDNRIEAAKNEKIKFIAAKFLVYDLPENHFDFIYLDSVLEHVLEPKQYLLKISKLLNQNGILYIGVPNEDSLFNDVRKIIFNLLGKKQLSAKIKPFDTPYHVVGFNKKSLNYIFDETRLQIKLLRNFGRKFEFLSSSPKHKAFWISFFFLLPIEFIGKLSKKDVYYDAYLSKKNSK